MRNQGVWAKLLLLVTVSVVAFCAMGIYGINNTRTTFESVDKVRATALEFREGALTITDPLNQLRQLSLTMVMAPNKKLQEELNQKQNKLTQSVDLTLSNWDISSADQQEIAAFEAFQQSWSDYKKIKDSTVNNVLLDYREEAFINAIGAEDQQFTEVKRKLAMWMKTKMNNADETYASAKERYTRASQGYIAAIVVLTIVVAALGYFTATTIIGPIKTIRDAASRIAESAANASIDVLDERIVLNSKDELGTLATAFNKMIENLQLTLVKLSVEERRTQAVLNSTADGIMTVNEKGIVQSLNTSAERLLECSAESAVGTSVATMVPALSQNGDVERNLEPGESKAIGGEHEVEARTKNGRQLPIALRVSEMNYMGEKLFIATLQDITSRKQAETERKTLFRAIQDAVQRLAIASQQILSTTSEQATGSQEQATSVAETVSTVSEIAQTAQQVVERANQVTNSARRADEVGNAGRQAIEESIESMQQVKEQVESLAENILSLAERAQAIGEITATVNDIAEQTNVLALNAAVEASRAGEHGKGFAVVAAEVKSLAEQSKKATNQVRQILSEIQQATNNAVLSTEHGTRAVATANGVIEKAGGTISELVSTLADSAKSATQIYASANQQAAGVTQLNEGIQNIDKVTKNNVEAIGQIELSARNLNDLSGELAQLTQ